MSRKWSSSPANSTERTPSAAWASPTSKPPSTTKSGPTWKKSGRRDAACCVLYHASRFKFHFSRLDVPKPKPLFLVERGFQNSLLTAHPQLDFGISPARLLKPVIRLVAGRAGKLEEGAYVVIDKPQVN